MTCYMTNVCEHHSPPTALINTTFLRAVSFVKEIQYYIITTYQQQQPPTHPHNFQVINICL